MKRYLVFSDIHGSMHSLFRLKRLMAEHDGALFAGDGIVMLPEFTEKEFYKVGGNCDFSGESELVLELQGAKILLTHGHTYGVKRGYDALAARAKQLGCQAAIFGHTHKALVQLYNDILLINPGSCKGGYEGATYATLIISNEKPSAIINELE